VKGEWFISGAVFQSLIILLKNEYGHACVDDVQLLIYDCMAMEVALVL